MGRCWQMLHHPLGEPIIRYLLLMVGKEHLNHLLISNVQAHRLIIASYILIIFSHNHSVLSNLLIYFFLVTNAT